MAALVVQSRFAGLKIEDDDYPPSHDAQKGKKSTKSNPNKKLDSSKKNKSTNVKAQQNNNQPKKKKAKASMPSSVQWEVWRQKDEELVNGHYESELQQAMLLSKLDYEEKKDVYNRLKKDAEVERKAAENSARAAIKKQKKKNIMSLEQFNDMVSGEESRNHPEEEKEPHSERKPPPPDTEFFNRVNDEARNEYLKDKINERVKHRQPVSDEVMTRIQFTDTIEQKDKEIAVLRQQIVTLKDELFTVKSRNKKLCNILGQGEMRDKAEVLVEVERLRGVQAELTAEVAELHSQLERERSKNTDSRTKDKKRKGGSIEK